MKCLQIRQHQPASGQLQMFSERRGAGNAGPLDWSDNQSADLER